MALCRLCLSIPLDDLPDFSSYYCPMTSWKHINPFQLEYRAPVPEGLPGYPHHSDLQSLRLSAAGCSLCRLVLSQIELVIEEFRVAQQDDFFRRTHRDGYPTFGLFLANRQRVGDGFLILSHSTTRGVIYLLGGIGLVVRDDDPLAVSCPGRVVNDISGNATTLSRARAWMQSCHGHESCFKKSPSLPTRVLDLGEDSIRNSSAVRLVEPPPGTQGQYVALSHCWGKYGLPITTKKNKDQRMESISLAEMSRSFADAIAITRSLQIRFIWIDSLCIIQDDLDDWNEEAAKMHSVYSNSFLTISVTGAKDGSTGCFANRPLKEYIKLPHTNKDGISGDVFAFALPIDKEVDTNKYITMDDEPLSDRGWCFQERVLSRRILHFATDQMYFECMEGFRSEDGTRLPMRYFSMHGKLGSSRLPLHRGANPTSYNDLWYHFLYSYGPRKLTKGSDKLPALGGIAAMFSEKLNDQYFAGIWRNSMIQGLLWQGLEIVQVEDRNPSWSWASINGIPANALIGRWEPIGHILDCHAAVQGTNRFGTVAEAWIKMEAPLIPLILHEVQDMYKSTGLPSSPKHLHFRTPQGSRPGSYGRFDFIGERHVKAEALAREGYLFALILAVGVGSQSRYYSSLIVARAEGQPERHMKRLGFLNQEIESLGIDEARSLRSIVTLF